MKCARHRLMAATFVTASLAACATTAPATGSNFVPIAIADLRFGDGQALPANLNEMPDGCPATWGAPPGSGTDPVLSGHEREWYSRHFAAAGERALSSYQTEMQPVRLLRFTWLRTFDHPVIVRLAEYSGERWVVHATRLSGAGGYDEGDIDARVSRDLSTSEVEALRGLLAESALFEMSLDDCIYQIDENGEEVIVVMADGARWLVEGLDEQGYRYVNRQSPETGAVYDFGVFALGLTGWDVEPIY